jgi:serine/threonine protein kinase
MAYKFEEASLINKLSSIATKSPRGDSHSYKTINSGDLQPQHESSNTLAPVTPTRARKLMDVLTPLLQGGSRKKAEIPSPKTAVMKLPQFSNFGTLDALNKSEDSGADLSAKTESKATSNLKPKDTSSPAAPVKPVHIEIDLPKESPARSPRTPQPMVDLPRAAPTYTPSIVTPHLGRLLNDAKFCKLVVPPKSDPDAPPTAANLNTTFCVSKTLPPKMARAHWGLEDFTLLDKLYTGYASNVYKATCKRSGEIVVLKIYTLSSVCELYRYQIYREVQVHSSLHHENIVHLLASFQEGEKVVMVQEYADGSDLFALLHKYGGRLSERLAVQMILDPFLRVLQYLHSRGIMHRDIKPENILFTKSMVLKLGDFGLAIDMREERPVTRAGTLDYMAPEILKCPYKSRPEENKEVVRLHYSARVDAWAVGVLTYELLVGFPPFFDQSRTATEDRINNSTPTFPATLTEDARAFVAAALSKNPTDRPSTPDMLHHPWISAHRCKRSVRVLPLLPGAIAGSNAHDGFAIASPKDAMHFSPVSLNSPKLVAPATPTKAHTSGLSVLPPSLSAIIASLKAYPSLGKRASGQDSPTSPSSSLLHHKNADGHVNVKTSSSNISSTPTPKHLLSENFDASAGRV